MKTTFYKFLPFVLGGVLGWFLFRPPAFLPGNVWLRFGIHFALILAVMIGMVVALVAAGLPKQVQLRPASGKLLEGLAELRPLAARFRELGFSPLGPALEFGSKPPALVLPMADEEPRVLGNLFKTATAISKIGHDFVSELAGGGTLTTLADPAGASLTAGPRAFRQVLPDHSPRELLQAHWESLAYLEALGFPVQTLRVDRYEESVARDIADKRKEFFGAPLRNSLSLYWRAVTKRVLCRGLVKHNAEAQSKLRALGRLAPSRLRA